MPKAVSKPHAPTASLEILAANSGLLAPTAAELVTDLENGDESAMLAKIQKLGQRDYVAVAQSLQKLSAALASYAQSWSGVELP